MLDFLTTWLISNILGTDRQIAAALHPAERKPADHDEGLKVSPVARAHRYRRLLCAAFLDLDHFKRINDTLGHSVGDRVLVAAAMSLKRNLRESDTLGRIGGEEFVVLMPETSLDYALAAAERWRDEALYQVKSEGRNCIRASVFHVVPSCAPFAAPS